MINIEKMLKQEIEPQLGDSGMYGYAFEKRANIDYENTPIYNEDKELSTYHLLTKCLGEDYLTNKINKLLKKEKNIIFEIDETLEEISKINEYYELEDFVNEFDDIDEDIKAELLDIFKEFTNYDVIDGFFTKTDNTYNFDNVLDSDFQFRSFGNEYITYIILRTHNGADIRGGYSDWACFLIVDGDFDTYMVGYEKLN